MTEEVQWVDDMGTVLTRLKEKGIQALVVRNYNFEPTYALTNCTDPAVLAALATAVNSVNMQEPPENES